MNETSRQEMMNAMREARTLWDSLLARVGRRRMTNLSVIEGWTVKDIVAHISWYEREMVGMLHAKALVGSELWNLPQDQRNSPIYEENKHRTLKDVLSESERVFQQLMEAFASLSEEDLHDPSRYQYMPADWVPWKVIAGNSFEHYHQHIPDIEHWLEGMT